MVLVSM